MHVSQLPYVTLDLSAGGMARIQLALELGPLEERYVVLKWLDAESTRGDPHASRRFLDEARLALELHHPNIVTVHQVLEVEGRHCIVMAWIRGMSLRQVLQQRARGPVPPRIACRVVHDICLALHHAWHARNERTGMPLHVVHRDLKPENVMLTLLGQTKVIDFGVAKATSLLTPAALHATPQYASPEQAGEILAVYGKTARPLEDEAPLDGRSDLFCAGLILQELLTGEPVFPPPREFSEEAGLELLSLIHQEPVVPAELPAALAPIVHRALAYQRRHRYATGQDMAEALAKAGLATEQEVASFLEGLFPEARSKVQALEESLRARQRALPVAAPPVPIPLTVPTPVTPPPEVAPAPVEAARPRSRARWVGLAAGLVALVAVGVGAARWYGARMQPSPERSALRLVPEGPIPEDGAFSLFLDVRNAEGQPVTGQPVRFEVTGASGAKVELSGLVTDELGRVQGQLSWQRPEQVSIVPVLGEGRHRVRLGASAATFQALPPDVSQSQLVAPPQVTAGERVALSVTLRDVHGHPVADTPVRFVLEGEEPLSGEARTGAKGQAPFSFEPRRAGEHTAKASIETSRGWTELAPVAVRLVAGPPRLENVTLGVEPAQALADASASILLTAQVRDAYGNPVAGHPLLLRVDGEGNELTQPGVTGPEGLARGELRSARAGEKQVCLRVEGLAEERCQGVRFVAGPAAREGLQLVAKPRQVQADGRSACVLELAVQDARGNPLEGVPVLLSVKGVGTLVERKVLTGAEGRAYARLRSRQTGKSTVTMRLEGLPLTKSESVQFVAGSPDRQDSTLIVSSRTIPADGQTPLRVTVRVMDSEENTVRGRYVLFRMLGVGPEQQRRAGPTDEDGEASASFTSVIAGEGTLTAELEPSSQEGAPVFVSAQETVRFTAGSPGRPSLSVEPPRGRAGGPLQLTVEVWDESHRNPLSGVEVRWEVEGASESFALRPSKTDERGRVTVGVTPNRAGNVTFVAKVGDSGQEVESRLNVGIDSGPPHEVRLEAEPGSSSLRADGADRARLALRLVDAQGNAVRGQAVHWEGLEPEDTLVPESDTTDATGRIRATFTTSKPGRKTVKAVVAGTKLEASLSLTAEAQQPLAPGASPSAGEPAAPAPEQEAGTPAEPPAPDVGEEPGEAEAEGP